MNKKKPIYKLAVILSILFLIVSCEESEEGCFDLLSRNYGFHAVTECDSCCVYPDFSLRLNYINDTFSYSIADTLVSAAGDSLKLSRLELMFSQFILNAQDSSYGIRDSLSINNFLVPDDFVYFRSSSSKIVGKTRFEDTLAHVNFKLGFEESEMAKYQPFSNIDSDSNLDLALDSLYDNEKNEFYYGRIVMNFGDSIRDLRLSNNAFSYKYNLDKFISAGTDWNLVLELDINKLIKNFDKNLTDKELINLINLNIETALSLE